MALGPLVFESYFRPQVWGGRNLATSLQKPLPREGKYGEAWEISAHPHHVSRVKEGPCQGMSLSDLHESRAQELYGRQVPSDGKFPLLIKLLDCQELLSVQVHPTDEIAAELLGNEKGKTEAWVVMEAGPNAQIYAGLKPGVTRADLERHLDAGTVDQCLHVFQPKPGDCLFLTAGTVHAVGGGVVMAEVQQSSDATFRLFDWNRLGQDGKPRALHRPESLRSINFSMGPRAPQMPEPFTSGEPDAEGESLVRCPYFSMDRYRLHGALPVPYREQFSIWMVLDGAANLSGPGYERSFRRGETVLLPASAPPGTWTPSSTDGSVYLMGVTLGPAVRP